MSWFFFTSARSCALKRVESGVALAEGAVCAAGRNIFLERQGRGQDGWLSWGGFLCHQSYSLRHLL